LLWIVSRNLDSPLLLFPQPVKAYPDTNREFFSELLQEGSSVCAFPTAPA
jgi:hypothetical protein